MKFYLVDENEEKLFYTISDNTWEVEKFPILVNIYVNNFLIITR